MKNPITLSNNTVAGDMAGGNISHSHFYSGQPSTLRDLAVKFRIECNEDQRLSDFIETLQHYVAIAPTQPTRDLTTKLLASGRADLVDEALILKEQFYKKLIRFQFNQQAQEIFAHILSKIHAFFTYKVCPKINENIPRSQIDDLIYSELLEPIYNDIGNCSLGVDLRDLQGMLYFLGGNCHIKWD